MKVFAKLWPLTVLVALTGCSHFSGNIPRQTALVPKGSLHIFPSYSISYASMVQVGLVLGAVYYISDPTSPTWNITETRLPDNRVFYKLGLQFVHLGGDGEAHNILVRRVEALALEQGMAGYQIQRYEEAIDSRMLFPQRTVYAEVLLLAAK